VRAPTALLDVTNTVPLGDARAVAEAVDGIFVDAFGAGRHERELLHAGFAFVDRLYAGTHDGYLACDMPYHDLRHALDTALATARLAAGARDASCALSPDDALVAVLLALMHDIGYIRKSSEADICGPQLTTGHEKRGAAFAASWLRTTTLAGRAELAPAIRGTELGIDLERLVAGREPAFATVGRMIGAADLLCQAADRVYLERCYYHLYPELVLAGADRTGLGEGAADYLYRDGLELVRQTGDFFAKYFRPRLDNDFAQVVPSLARHFGGENPYAEAVARNLDRQARIAADGGAALLGDEPATTTTGLAPIYHPPRPATRA
jgi:hypothetical protein